MFHRVMDAKPCSNGLESGWRLRGTSVTWDELVAWVGDDPVLSLREVVEALETGRSPPPGTVLTFDDGYAEWGEVGAQLAQRDWSATFFVCMAMLEVARLHAIDAYYSILDTTECGHLAGVTPDGRHFDVPLASNADKRALVMGGLKDLVRDPLTQDAALEVIAEAAGVDLREVERRPLHLRDSQLALLSEQGHAIGFHGHRHVHLTDLGRDDLQRELRLPEVFQGLRADHFSYPDGAFDARVASAVRDAGFRAAVTCIAGQVTDHTDPWRIPRVFATPSLRE